MTLACSLALGLAAAGARADESDRRVEAHALGGWAYGNTDGNDYLVGTSQGEYSNANFALNVSTHPDERLALVGQVEWHQEDAETEVELDFVFAEWRFSDLARLRVGKVKQPFGISTEVFDVGTLRPFYALPQALYGPVGFVSEGILGVNLTGAHEGKSGWGASYDAYLGGQIVEEYEAPEAILRGEPVSGKGFHTEATRDLIGGRVTLESPGGLRLGASGYTGKVHDDDRRSGFGLHAEYLQGPWSLRAELARERAPEHRKRAVYAEAARRFGPRWQVAAQYGHLRSELPEVPTPTESRLLEHDELAFGLNYWFTPGFVLKASLHQVDGNRLATREPDELLEALEEGELRRKTRLFLVGAQFSF